MRIEEKMRKMDRRDFMKGITLASASCCLAGSDAMPQKAQGGLPNVVIILADDMGYGDLNCQNPDSRIPTPNLDKLAKQGMRFTDAHTPSAVCTPTRYGLLTGRYAWRTRLKKSVLGPYSSPLIEKNRQTLATVLKSKGYTAACIGKWHLGMQWGTKNPQDRLPPLWDNKFDQSKIDLSKPITGGPLSAGFDSYFGTDVPNFPPYCYIEDDHVLGPIPKEPKPNNMYGKPGHMQDGWDLHRILPGLRDRAASYIKKRAETPDTPFFLYMPLTSPHRPIVPNKEWAGRSKAGDYGDFIAETDGVIGDVMKALDQAGLTKNTLFIMTSDNGSCGPAGDPHLRGKDWHSNMSVTTMFGHKPNAPWRGMKADTFEGGHRIPFIVRWPGKVAPDSINDQTICLVDMMRTVSSIVGHKLSTDAAEDSVDILPTLIDPGKQVRSDLIHHSSRGMFAIRQGDWKLILGKGSGGWTRVRTSKKDPPGQLYNLAEDPKEDNNLYTEHPEIVQRLTALLNQYRETGRSTSIQ